MSRFNPSIPLQRRGAALIIGIALCGLLAPAMAQEKPATGTIKDLNPDSAKPWRSVVVPANYKLGPGDQLSVRVERFAQYSHSGVLVTPDGKISLPVYGELKVVNMTLPDVEKELRKRISVRLLHPELLTLSLDRPRSQSTYAVYMLGAGIRSQGPTAIQLNYRLTEALAKAGGLTGRPEEINATLTRGDNRPVPLDLKAAIEQSSSEANVRVLPNDVLTFTPQEVQTLMLDGDIARPGAYQLRRYPTPGGNELPLQPKLRDAIIASGGLAAKTGSGSQTTGTQVTGSAPAPPVRYTGYVLRNKEKLPLAISDVMDYSDPAANITLQPKDYIRIDAVPPTRVYVEGSVPNKGYLYMAPEAGVVEAIATAGGLSVPPAKAVATVRRGGQIITVDLDKALLSNDPKSNIRLQTGDILIIAEEPRINVTLAGEFNKPISVDVDPNTRLTDAVALAGGLKVLPTDARLTILRTIPVAGATATATVPGVSPSPGSPTKNSKQMVISIDPAALFNANDMSQNPQLQDGDVINAGEIKKSTVFVSGEVGQVGPQIVKENEGLTTLLTRAGGTKPGAALTEITVTRNGARTVVDAYNAVTAGADLNFPLQDGDYVVVPRVKKNILLMEAVNQGGVYPLPERETLTALGAIAMAGGTTADANTKQIIVLRPKAGSVDNTDGKDMETHLINIKDMVQRGDWSANTPLQAGDVVYVPRKEATKSVLNQAARSAGAALTIFRLGNVF